MDKFIIGTIKKIALIIIAAAFTASGMIVIISQPYNLMFMGMIVFMAGLFLFFWTTFLYCPSNDKITKIGE